jgi:hypothetical protein
MTVDTEEAAPARAGTTAIGTVFNAWRRSMAPPRR